MKERWLRIGGLGLSLFAVNVIGRVVTKIVGEDASTVIASVALGTILLGMIGAGVWWAIRHPFARLFFEIGAAVLIFTVLSLFIGPLVVADSPFKNGLAFFVLQFLLLLAVGLGGGLLGFAFAVASGKDWKGQGLRQYEQARRRRSARTARRVRG